MKIKHLLAPLGAFCAIAALVGCASTNRQVSESSLDEKNLQRDEAQASTGLSQPVFLDERAFRKLDIDTTGAVTLDQWQQLDTSAGPKENFRALDVNGDGQINPTEFLTQTPKDSKRYHLFGEPDKTNDDYVSWDTQLFQQPGWQLFSIRF